MFTGFASENTPAIQVWDFFRTFASTGANRSVSLPDDCAPIQFFRTGATTNAIQVYLPSAPIEGKQIKICNSRYGFNDQKINIYSSDVSPNGTANPIAVLGQGQTLDFCYSKNFISLTPAATFTASGWISLNQAPASAANPYSVILGGDSNNSISTYSSVVGGSSNTASGTGSFLGGGSSSTASGTYSAVVGGSSNIASENSAAVVGGTGNTASGQNSAVVGGQNNSASFTNAIIIGSSGSSAGGGRAAVIGGQNNTANGNSAVVVGADSGTASATNSAVIGGQNNTANGFNAAVVGGARGTARSIIGNFVTSASNTPIQSASGVQQTALLVLGRQTTDATATRLASDANAASTTNQVILPNNSAYTFQGTCIANVTGGGTTSGWKFEGVIKRGANAASTALVAAVTPTVIAQDAGAVTWVLAVTADTTNGGIAVTVTGAAATTIRWVVQIETTEVTF